MRAKVENPEEAARAAVQRRFAKAFFEGDLQAMGEAAVDGASPDADLHGAAPLRLAIEYGWMDRARALLGLGADPWSARAAARAL